MQNKIYKFPKDFTWGAATAAFQIEGGWNADGKGESIWDHEGHTTKNIRNLHTGDIACDSYHLYKEDVKLMKFLGLKAYRFSIAWTRIFPDGTGRVNQKGLDYYNRLVDELLKNKIIPYITFYHWDLPQKLEKKGGWINKDISYAYADYAKEVLKSLSDRVTNWITINEGPCIADWYKKKTKREYNQVIHNILLAHGLGVLAVRAYGRNGSEVGMAHNPFSKIPFSTSKNDVLAAKKAWVSGNEWWFDPMFLGKYPEKKWKEFKNDVPEITAEEMKIISMPVDFLGLNIYSAQVIKAGGKEGFKVVDYPSEHLRTLIGWPVDPGCLYHGFKIPYETYDIKKMYITENGASFTDALMHDKKVYDFQRVDYYKTHLTSVSKLIKDGVNVKGYFAWSLIDNMEWHWGYQQRFGLFYTDFSTLKRYPKESAYYYKKVIKNSRVV